MAYYALNVQSGTPKRAVITRVKTSRVQADIKDSSWLICLRIFEICLYVESF